MSGGRDQLRQQTGNCEHCGHPWTAHGKQCQERGCYWQPPQPPKPEPEPPSERDLLIAKVREAIFAELDRQHENGEIDAAGYWHSEWGHLDGEPDWNRIAAAAFDVMCQAWSPPF